MNHYNDNPVLPGNVAAACKVSEERPTVVLCSFNNAQDERSLGKKSLLRKRGNDKFRQEAMKNGESNADILRWRAELLIKNAMMAFKLEECTNKEGLNERMEFFASFEGASQAHLQISWRRRP